MEIGMFWGREGVGHASPLPQKGRVALVGVQLRAGEEDVLAQVGQTLEVDRVVKAANFDI